MNEIYNHIFIKGAKEQLVDFINKSDNVRISSFDEIEDINKDVQQYDELTCADLTLCSWKPLFYKHKKQLPLIRWIDDERALIKEKFPDEWESIVSTMHIDDFPATLLTELICLYDEWTKGKQVNNGSENDYNQKAFGIEYDVPLLEPTVTKIGNNVYSVCFTCTTEYEISEQWLYAMQEEYPDLIFVLMSQEEFGDFVKATTGNKIKLFESTNIGHDIDFDKNNVDATLDLLDLIDCVVDACFNIIDDYLLYNTIPGTFKNKAE